jgi:hypothetical protein
MYLYFQTVENSQQPWASTPEAQAEAIRRDKAFHMSIYRLSELPGDQVSSDDIAYKGDLWFDIDHKPADDTPEAKHAAIQTAIMDTRRLLGWLLNEGVDPQYCRIFASGGKGFHVCVPGKLFDVTKAVKGLPKIHKFMASIIATRASITGIDMSLYSMGKGKLLRVENKLRANGKYKVPISYDELREITPEQYEQVTSEPREEVINPPQGYSEELRNLYVEGKDLVAELRKHNFQAVPSEQLAVFSDDNHPTCINWIVDHVNIREGTGRFNSGKMSIARYVMSAPITDTERNKLIDSFAQNWTSTRCHTTEARKKAVLETLNYGREQGFSCKFMTNILADSPCRDCKLVQEQRRLQAEEIPIDVTPLGYFRQTTRGPGQKLSNFTLVPRRKVCGAEDDPNTFIAFEYAIHQVRAGPEAEPIGSITITHKAWQSNAEFKKQISSYLNLNWHGTDSDLQHLKGLLTSPMSLTTGVEEVRQVTAVGIHPFVDDKRGIEEYVWVEENYSRTSSGVANTHKFIGTMSPMGGERTVKLAGVQRYDGRTDETTNEVIRAVLNMNTFDILVPTLGWMFACWLRTHIRSKGTTNKHLPVLQIYGSAGKGKTETSTLLSVLAGADYVNSEPMMITSSTPYTIRNEAASSTTVPRIFDEFNEQRGPDKNKYAQAYEAVKAAARGSAMARGSVQNNEVVIDQKFATAPLITLATQENTKMEINDRSVPVNITEAERTGDHVRSFFYARDNVKKLFPVTRLAMETTLALPDDWVTEAIERGYQDLPKTMQANRSAQNWQIVLVGLEYMRYVMEQGHAPRDIIDTCVRYRLDMIAWLNSSAARLTLRAKKEEIDVILETFGEMIAHDSGSLSRKFKHGENYIIVGETLHIWSALFFTHYLRFCRETLNRNAELNSISQFNVLMEHQPYNLGKGLVPAGTPAPSNWHSLSIPKLREKGLNIENFFLETGNPNGV